MNQYTPGSQIHFAASFQLATGKLVDVTNARVVLQDPVAGASEVPLVKQETGMYGATWTVPADATSGFYEWYYAGTYDVGDGAQEYTSPMYFFEVVDVGAYASPLPAGAYATVGDIRARLRKLTTTVMSDDVVGQHIGEAQGEVDAALVGRYSVPFTTVPTYLRGITCDLAVAAVLNVIYSGDGSTEETPLSVRVRAMGRGKLQDLIDGKKTLPGQVQKARFRMARYDGSGKRPVLARFDGTSVADY